MDLVERTHYTRNNTNCEAAAITMHRAGHNVWFRINITNKVAVGDTALDMITLKFNTLGFNNLSNTMVNAVGATDGGNAVVIYNLDYKSGLLKTNDAFVKGSTSGVAVGNTIYFHFSQNINYNAMLDSACDKFYWQKTS